MYMYYLLSYRLLQVMYMYYLLGYRLLGNNDDFYNQADGGRMSRAPARNMAGGGGNIARRSKIFRSMNHIQRAQVRRLWPLDMSCGVVTTQAQNTFDTNLMSSNNI